MDSSEERRAGGRRVPLRLPVELAHAGYVDGFGADAIDLSAGGMAMQAGCLPDVGERFACRFDAVSSPGTPASATGEVVWARLDDQHTGTFGLRFVDLDAGAARLIARMLNDRKPTAVGLGAEENARAASLEIEGMQEPVPASIDDARGFATFEQPLDLFKLGRVVRRRSGRTPREGSIAKVELRVLGNTPMLAVTVDFEQDRPFGELELELDADARRQLEALRVELEASAPDTGASDAGASDAGDAGVTGQPGMIETVVRTSRVTETEFSVPPPAPVEAEGAQDAGPASQLDLALEAEAAAASDAAESEATGTLDATEANVVEAERGVPVSNHTMQLWPPTIAMGETEAHDAWWTGEQARTDAEEFDAATESEVAEPLVAPLRSSIDAREPSVTFALLREAESQVSEAEAPVRAPRLNEELDAEIEAMAALSARRWPPRLPDGLVEHADRALTTARRLWVLGRAAVVAASAMLLPWLSARAQRALPPVRGGMFRASALAAAFYKRHIVARARATRRVIVVAVRRRRRRTTMAGPQTSAAPQTSEREASTEAFEAAPRRWIAGALAGTVAVGLGAYFVAPMFAAPTASSAQVSAPSSAKSHAGKSAKMRARGKSTRAEVASQTASKPSSPSSAGTATKVAAAAATIAAAAGSTSAAAAAAQSAPSTPVAAAAPAPAPSKPVVFGARDVRSAQRFTLRMSSPVTALRGTADARGFTIVIPGSLSLDPAGPIRKQHPSVESAMILNRGGESQLTIRFASGKKPAYQVRGDGARLDILIEGA